MDEIYEGMRERVSVPADTTSYHEWRQRIERQGARYMSEEEMICAYRDALRYGPASAFTTTTGSLVEHVFRLLEHVIAADSQVKAMAAQMDDDTELYEIDDDPLSIFAGDREPTLQEQLPYAEVGWFNVVVQQWQ